MVIKSVWKVPPAANLLDQSMVSNRWGALGGKETRSTLEDMWRLLCRSGCLMEILFLSGHLPSPRAQQGGQKTSYYICEFLARKHEVHLLSFVTEDEVQSFRAEDMGIFRSWDLVPVTK